MKNDLPYTPADVLDISTPLQHFKIKAVARLAEIFGFWSYPDPKTATDLEEMSMPRDMFYWVAKSINPITRMEKGVPADFLLTDKSIVGLPQDFKKGTSVTIGAAGDILQSEGLEHIKDTLYASVSDLLFDRDISYANYESPITKGPLVKELIGDKAAPIECASREQFEALTSHKGKHFTVLNTANNHSFDRGVEGLDNTLQAMAENGILETGTNRTPAEHGKGRILEKNGIRIGFVSATFGLNGQPVPPGEEYRVNHSKLLPKAADPDLALLKRQIDDCKAQGADFIVASMHWGYEFECFPRKKQVIAARDLVEYGADAIISHHPHVIQPVEYYRTKRDPNRVAPISYSLGSVTWGYTAPYIVLSLIQNLTLAKGSVQGQARTYVEAADVTPVFRSAVNNGGRLDTRLEKLADHIDGRSTRHSAEYVAKIRKYADLVLGKDTWLDAGLSNAGNIPMKKVQGMTY